MESRLNFSALVVTLLLASGPGAGAVDPVPGGLLGPGQLILSPESGLVVPYDCVLYVKATGGSASAKSTLGTGAQAGEFKAVITGLPHNPAPRKEVKLGAFLAGDSVPLAIRTEWGGKTYFAFAKGMDKGSRHTFGDPDKNAEGKGILRPLKRPGVWSLSLDDAASFLIDDDDGDIVLEIRLKRP